MTLELISVSLFQIDSRIMTAGYGYEYTPDNFPTYEAPSLSKLEEQGIRFVRLSWIDYTNTSCFRVIPISHFKHILASERPAISVTAAALGLVFNTTTPDFGSAGENVYVPDLQSLRPAAYAKGHASVFGWFESKEGEPRSLGLCPRGLLKRIVECVADWRSVDGINS
jgi:glutamine synthetase